MPRRTPSGTKGLIKRHMARCPHRTAPTRCACEWRGRYKDQEVGLGIWADITVDPRTLGQAREVFARMVTAIDEDRFDARGEARSLGTSQRFDHFIDEWVTHYANKAGIDERGHTSTGTPSMLQVIKTEKVAGVCLGSMTLEQLVANPLTIERWLDGILAAGRRIAHRNGKGFRLVKWKPTTWNHYYELLHSICHRATLWRTNDTPRMDRNPMDYFERKKVAKKTFKANFRPNRIYEDVEDRLFAALPVLNLPLHLPNTRAKLTMDKADEIRAQAASGAFQKDIARAFDISPAVVCDIVSGKIWNPAKYVPTTKGDEMRRRLIGAFDGGLRAGEMMLVQLKHVNFRRPRVFIDDEGTRIECYELELPPANTKGGKTTNETQYVIAGTDRFKLMLDQRRTQLKNNPDAYIFGTEAGAYQQGFRTQWEKLFTAAGLDYGRNKGLVWHTTRHEFISRTAETTKDAVLTQEIARLKDLETARIYIHTRDDRKLAAAVGLNRR